MNQRGAFIMDVRFNNVLEKYKESTKRKACSIKIVNGEPTIMDNKIGGYPYIPVGEEIPLDKNGENMILLLQVNLKEVHLENFPKEGILEVFVDKNLSYPCDYKIKCFKDNFEYRKDLEISDGFVTKSIKIELCDEEIHEPVSNEDGEELACELFNEEFEESITNIFDIDDLDYDGTAEIFFNEINYPFGVIGGYANYTQNDPGYNSDNEYMCLFCIDSQLDNKNLHIGDCGIIFGFIKKEDLLKENFESAIVDWDCF